MRVYARTPKQGFLVLGCGKVAGKCPGPKHGDGAVGKGDYGGDAGWAGPVNEVVQQVTVAQMDSVEDTDGQHRVLIRGKAGQTLAEAHRSCWSPISRGIQRSFWLRWLRENKNRRFTAPEGRQQHSWGR
jgi:hypothetical protein